MSRYASIYPLVNARALASRIFTYEVPDEVEKGAVVEVRFARSKARGVVVDVDGGAPEGIEVSAICLLYTSPSPRDKRQSRMPSSA